MHYSLGRSARKALEPALFILCGASAAIRFLKGIDPGWLYSGVVLLYSIFCAIRNWWKNKGK